MRDTIEVHHPQPQTRLPEHEQAARKQRAAIADLTPVSKPVPPPPSPPHVAHNWPFAWRAR